MHILVSLIMLPLSLFGSFYSDDDTNAYIEINNGYIFVYDQKSNTFIKSAQVALEDTETKTKAFYLDFNFDGKNDLAIVESQYGSSASYTLLLQSKESFVYSEQLSTIMAGIDSFELRSKKRVIITNHTMAHSVSYESHYKALKNTFIHIKEIETAHMGYLPYRITITTHYNKGKSSTEVTRELDTDGDVDLVRFRLKKSDKVVHIFYSSRELNYALTKPKKDKNYAEVEFNYPTGYPDEKEQKPIAIKESKNSIELSFSNENAHYTVYQNSKEGKVVSTGVRVRTQGKTYDLQGDAASLHGNLKAVIK